MSSSQEDHYSDGSIAPNPPRPKKRANTTASTSSSNGQSQAFFFVDPASSTREKRAHVMRHHIQAKRKQNMIANHVDRQSRREPRVFPWMKKSNVADGRSNKSPSKFQPSTYSKLENGHGTTTPVSHTTPPMTGIRSVSPPARATLDTSVPWAEEELVDLWMSRLTYWSGQNIHLKTKVFQTSLVHRAALDAIILGYAARYEHQLSPGSDDAKVRHYQSRSQQALMSKSGYESPIFDDDVFSLVLTGLALQEARFGDQNKSADYCRHARELLLNLQSHCIDTIGRPLLIYVLTITDPRLPAIKVDEIAQMIDFLRLVCRSMKETSKHNEVPQRTAAFQFDSPLFQLLSSGPRPTQVPVDHRDFVINKDRLTTEWSRTTAVIYIVLALCEFRGEKSKVARFLDHLHRIIKEYDLDRELACESLMYFMVEETFDEDLKNPDRAWQAIDLLHIQKRLPYELQFRFNDMLLNYLTLTPSIMTADAFERDLYISVLGKIC